MEWLFILVAIFAFVGILVVIIFSFLRSEKGDHKDGGGIKVGGQDNVAFFQPQSDRAGQLGERMINNALRRLLRSDEYILANLLLPLKNGLDAEIDAVIISRKGIFCVETKAWVAHVSGNEEDEYWYQKYDDPYKKDKEHINPVKQNTAHCELLERVLHYNYEIKNIVIFENCDSLKTNASCAFTFYSFASCFRKLSEDKLLKDDLNKVFATLSKYVATEDQLKEHRKLMSYKYK